MPLGLRRTLLKEKDRNQKRYVSKTQISAGSARPKELQWEIDTSQANLLYSHATALEVSLSSKQALVRAHERDRHSSLLTHVSGIAFFSTHHRGSDLVSWATLFGNLSVAASFGTSTDTGFVKDLRSRSEILDNIPKSFVGRGKRLISFYETERIDNLNSPSSIIGPCLQELATSVIINETLSEPETVCVSILYIKDMLRGLEAYTVAIYDVIVRMYFSPMVKWIACSGHIASSWIIPRNEHYDNLARKESRLEERDPMMEGMEICKFHRGFGRLPRRLSLQVLLPLWQSRSSRPLPRDELDDAEPASLSLADEQRLNDNHGAESARQLTFQERCSWIGSGGGYLARTGATSISFFAALYCCDLAEFLVVVSFRIDFMYASA
ncbi:hypothetical protein WAI453_012199 [Rhynchosporium graminicola]